MRTQIFDKVKYDLKGHPRSYLKDFSFFLSSIFIYEPILVQILMKPHNIKTQICKK